LLGIIVSAGKRSWPVFLLAALGLVLFYLTLISLLSRSVAHALELLWEDKLYVILIAFGFGLQLMLYKYFKDLKARSQNVIAAAGTGSSTATMIACCLHHLGDVAPIIGLSGAAIFLAQYKSYFMISGILMNFLGITLMLRILRKHIIMACHG